MYNGKIGDITNQGILDSKPLSRFRVDLTVHPSKSIKLVPGTSGNLVVKK